MPVQNADYSKTFTFFEADGVTPYSLLYASIEMQIKNARGQVAEATFANTGGAPNLTVGMPPNDNQVTLFVPAAQMADIIASQYWFDMIAVTVEDGTTYTTALCSGFFPVITGITDSPTPILPNYGCLDAGATDDISVNVGTSDITLVLLPSGPPGPQGPPGEAGSTTFQPQVVPAPPVSGFTLYVDQADGILKAINADGNISQLAYPS